MARASDFQKAERLNLALQWLRQGLSPAHAAQKLVRTYGLSPRQAYRYVERARALEQPVPVEDVKVVFTVKLPRALVEKLHHYAESTGQRLSVIVSRALGDWLRPGGGRG
jgi:predicted DNA-binding transcriptional regulator YafY